MKINRLRPALPMRWDICPTCRGNGRHAHAIGVLTHHDFAEDPEFAYDYMCGRYDRACDDCGATGKVRVVDDEALSAKQQAAYWADQRAAREVRDEERAELRQLGY